MTDKIYVAKLGKAVGLKGHLRLFIDSDFPEQFKKGATFTTNKKLTLKISEYLASRDLVKFENYEDMDLAKKLTNQQLFASIEETKNNCQLDENEFFWFDIVNCKVYEDNKLLGIVKEMHRFPLDDYMEIVTAESLVKENLPKTFLVPFKFENYVIDVDVDNKVIKVKNSFEILENS